MKLSRKMKIREIEAKIARMFGEVCCRVGKACANGMVWSSDFRKKLLREAGNDLLIAASELGDPELDRLAKDVVNKVNGGLGS